MNQIYDLNLWGGQRGEFFSGYGSHDTSITEPYLKVVIDFLRSFKNPLSVSDLGCGDFNIGKHLTPYCKSYTAIDIVENLIQQNKTYFASNNLEFYCLDIVNDQLPIAECAILRNVLQHLSNAEIHQVVQKLPQYKFVILTEHIPMGKYIPNIDIITGQGIRLKKSSGVDVLKPPFNLKIQTARDLTTYVEPDKKSKITTILYQLI
ncbi:class I SAM-dependent methyltransferase [Tamlana fucoidanivorans]|uniref:Class I SAM-dependent methyltransferase n=2 Tax=Allotamlana fucoidanivorans TaxID=2583814 RepID=A0A5C4SF81_9FLAO|nr:class I SAM-dependent methyltransferase [Tamlana fucoidanivorans]